MADFPIPQPFETPGERRGGRIALLLGGSLLLIPGLAMLFVEPLSGTTPQAVCSSGAWEWLGCKAGLYQWLPFALLLIGGLSVWGLTRMVKS